MIARRRCNADRLDGTIAEKKIADAGMPTAETRPVLIDGPVLIRPRYSVATGAVSNMKGTSQPRVAKIVITEMRIAAILRITVFRRTAVESGDAAPNLEIIRMNMLFTDQGRVAGSVGHPGKSITWYPILP